MLTSFMTFRSMLCCMSSMNTLSSGVMTSSTILSLISRALFTMSTSSLLSGSSFSCALAPCSFTSSLSSEQGRRGGGGEEGEEGEEGRGEGEGRRRRRGGGEGRGVMRGLLQRPQGGSESDQLS